MSVFAPAELANDIIDNAILEAMLRRDISKRTLPEEDRLLADEMAADLKTFAKAAWHIIEPKTTFVDNWHIDAICDHLQAVTDGQIQQLLINMPPRFMKSTLVSVAWPCWEWISAPHTRWIFASYAQGLATRDAVKSRRIIVHPWYQTRWGDKFRLTTDQNVKTRYENDKTGYRISTSVRGAATGEGGNRVVVDDPHNIREAHSDSIRNATVDWWNESMSTRLNDQRVDARVIVMQRVHEADVSGDALRQGGWVHLRLPNEYDGHKYTTVIGWEDPRAVPGELLWTERFGDDETAKAKITLGAYEYAGQYQQSPSPEEGGILKRAWFQFYTRDQLPLKWDRLVLSWDMSFKNLASADYVAGGVWGQRGADKYLLDLVHARLSFTETLTAFKDQVKNWPKAKAKLVEDKANGTAVIDVLHREIAGMIPIEPEGGKIARTHAASPQLQAGNVYFPHPDEAPWVEDFILECIRFPNGIHDDRLDMMTQALNWMEENGVPPDAVKSMPFGPSRSNPFAGSVRD